MFYVSFLVKDGRVRLSVGDDGLPVLCKELLWYVIFNANMFTQNAEPMGPVSRKVGKKLLLLVTVPYISSASTYPNNE